MVLKKGERECTPCQGGCWYCYKIDDDVGWLFSCEFDCNLHQACLENNINNQCAEDLELDIFKREFQYCL